MTPACRTQFIKQFGLRAFRQPLSDAQVARYEKLFASGATFEQGLELTITAMLQSPYFLYRRELGEPDREQARAGAADPVRGGQQHLVPDHAVDARRQLLAAAGGEPAGRRASRSTRTSSGCCRTRRTARPCNTFMGEWLESKRVAIVLKDPKVFDFQDALRADMERETAALVEDVVFTRKGSLGDLLKADYTFVNASLAKHYGIAGRHRRRS